MNLEKDNLKRNWRNLWVFGDSYTTPYECVHPSESFWGLLAAQANFSEIKNCSRRKNSLDSVFQLVIGMHSEFDWQQDFLIIGIPPLERITVFDDFKDTAYTGRQFVVDTWQEQEFNIQCHRSLVCLHGYEQGHTVAYHMRTWTEVQAMRQLFLLTQWLDAKQAHYLIVNLEQAWDKNNRWPPSEQLLDYCLAHPRCILFDNTYRSINQDVNPPADFDQFGWAGHHGATGNAWFFTQSLWPRFVQLETDHN